MTLVMEDAVEENSRITMGDAMVEDSASSLTVEQSVDVPSMEDITWADSCLIKNDAELSGPNWTSLLDALAEALSSHPDTPASIASEIDVSTGGVDAVASSSNVQETEPLVSLETMTYDISSTPTNEELEMNSNKTATDEQDEVEQLNTKYKNVFLPTYKEGMRGVDDFDAEFDALFTASGMEARTENIFKEWEIEFPAEEDEFTKQLEKVLSSLNISQSNPSKFDDIVAGFVELSIDDLISGISDMSLAENSG